MNEIAQCGLQRVEPSWCSRVVVRKCTGACARPCVQREGKAQGMQGDAGRSQGQKHTKDATCFQQSLNCTTRITA